LLADGAVVEILARPLPQGLYIGEKGFLDLLAQWKSPVAIKFQQHR